MSEIKIYLIKRTIPASGYQSAVVCGYDDKDALACSPFHSSEEVNIKQIGISTLNLRGIVNSNYVAWEDNG